MVSLSHLLFKAQASTPVEHYMEKLKISFPCHGDLDIIDLKVYHMVETGILKLLINNQVMMKFAT
jgi:hypothetical protein